jgi:hypothetical protein
VSIVTPGKIAALLESITPAQVQAMPPAERQLLTDQCQRIMREAIVADARAATAPKSGVLRRLDAGDRAE